MALRLRRVVWHSVSQLQLLDIVQRFAMFEHVFDSAISRSDEPPATEALSLAVSSVRWFSWSPSPRSTGSFLSCWELCVGTWIPRNFIDSRGPQRLCVLGGAGLSILRNGPLRVVGRCLSLAELPSDRRSWSRRGQLSLGFMGLWWLVFRATCPVALSAVASTSCSEGLSASFRPVTSSSMLSPCAFVWWLHPASCVGTSKLKRAHPSRGWLPWESSWAPPGRSACACLPCWACSIHTSSGPVGPPWFSVLSGWQAPVLCLLNLLNGRHPCFITTVMNCGCCVSTVSGISQMVGDCLRVWAGFVGCRGLPHDFAPVEPAQSRSARTSTSLSVFWNSRITNRLKHWDLPLCKDRNFDGLVDLLGLQALFGPDWRVETVSLYKSCTCWVSTSFLRGLRWCSCHVVPTDRLVGKHATTCVEGGTVYFSEHCCEDPGFVFILVGHALQLI